MPPCPRPSAPPEEFLSPGLAETLGASQRTPLGGSRKSLARQGSATCFDACGSVRSSAGGQVTHHRGLQNGSQNFQCPRQEKGSV
eukprot:3935368-Rhodomonas_salina.2